MRGVTFPVEDRDSGRILDLADVLRLLEPYIAGLEWAVDKRNFETAGDAAASTEFDLIAERTGRLSTSDLRRLAEAGLQLIDCELAACAPGDETPRLVLRAVDSSDWDIESDDESILASVHDGVPIAIDVPE